MKLFFYYGYTELSRFGLGIEFIGGSKSGIMITFLWWFILFGIEKGVAND